MRTLTLGVLLTATVLHPASGHGEEAGPVRVERDIPYAEPTNERQTLDVHGPASPAAGEENRPVVIWIHGGGWETGNKGLVQHKPAAFVDRGFVFVSVNYRLLPHVSMQEIVRDIAASIRWVHDHAASYGGDPEKLFVMGHSAGAQLAALICTDHSYLEAEGLSHSILKGCVPVDGDTYDIPLQIATSRARRQKEGKPEPKFGHPEKFGPPDLQLKYSAVTHIASGKQIPPFFILHVASHSDTTAQAQRLGQSLTDAGIRNTVFPARDTDHIKVYRDLGLPDDPATAALWDFLEQALE